MTANTQQTMAADVESDEYGEQWAGSTRVFWAIAGLILVILGALVVLRFGPELAEALRLQVGWIDSPAPEQSSNRQESQSIFYRLLSIVILSLFIPFTALSYIFSRRRVRKRELGEACRMLEIDYQHYAGNYNRETRDTHFLYAVMFTFVITILGLTAVLLGAELELNKGLNLLLRGPVSAETRIGQDQYQLHALLFFGVAFLGAYLWGLQEIIRRYFANDLVPGVYYTLGVRMIFAAILALLTYHVIGGFDTSAILTEQAGNFQGTILPMVAFLIGIFPQRALQYFTDKINLFARSEDKAAHEVPLELIQGISVNNRMRLREESIGSCFDLAHADFVRLLFTTPFPAKQLIDWILQAKLCVFFPDKLDDLRQYGVHSIEQLCKVEEATLDTLSTETKLTRSALTLAKDEADTDKAVAQLLTFRDRLDSIERIATAPGAGGQSVPAPRQNTLAQRTDQAA